MARTDADSVQRTQWTMIRGAAEGTEADREAFVRRYEGVVRSYLQARWRHSSLIREIDDAAQEVFLDCFKKGGVLERVEPERSGGFRAFFYGVILTTALRFERKRARNRVEPTEESLPWGEVPADEAGLSTVFDRAWAIALLKEAASLQAQWASGQGEDALRRVELLQLRFREGLPIRDIAQRWDVDPAWLHHEYAKARKEFQKALLEVVATHHPGAPRASERECARLLDILG